MQETPSNIYAALTGVINEDMVKRVIANCSLINQAQIPPKTVHLLVQPSGLWR